MSAHGFGHAMSAKEGHGYVRMNGVEVWNVFHSPWYGNCRGVNILEIDPIKCTKKKSHHFDTWGSQPAGGMLRDYLQKLTKGTVVVGVSVDEPRRHLGPVLPTLKELGINVADVQRRGSFAFIAQKSYPSRALLRKVITWKETIKQPAQLNAIIAGMPVENLVKACLNMLCELALISMVDILTSLLLLALLCDWSAGLEFSRLDIGLKMSREETLSKCGY